MPRIQESPKLENIGYGDLLLLDKKNKFYHFFEFIRRAYGSDIEKILKTINSVLLLGLSLKFVKNKLLRTILKIAQAAIPASMLGTEFYFKFKNYLKEIKEEKSSMYDRSMAIFFKMLGIEKDEKEPNPFHKYDLRLNTEIIFWILSKPKTSTIKIINFFDSEGKEIKTIDIENVETVKSIRILVEHGNLKFIWFIRLRSLGTSVFVEEAIAILKAEDIERDDLFKKIRKEIIRDFILTLDCKKNILKFDSLGSIKPYPRIKVVEKINQFNVKKLLTEINNVLKLGRRRAYALVGRQGTGKSSILRKIGEQATNHMVIYISPEDFNSTYKIKDRFELIRILGKCIIMIEDLDGYDFEEKNDRATTFLNEIDDVNDDLNAVIIVTINETNKVHKSIIDRPGRFDRVIEIGPPKTNQQLHEVFSSKFNKLKPIYCPQSRFKLPDLKEMNFKLIEKCILEKFTQAEISNAIMEQIFLDSKEIIEKNGRTWNNLDKDFFNERFKQAVDTHIETKRAIASADFSQKEIRYNKDDESVSECVPTATHCPV